MRTVFKIRRDLLQEIHADLSRPHHHAAERVGFIDCRLAELPRVGLAILAQTYLPVADEHYEESMVVGAMMNAHAIRTALQYAYNRRAAMFHVHRHDHRGLPRFSGTDLTEAGRFVPDFWKVQPYLIHGAIVLSFDRIHGRWWDPHTRRAQPVDEYVTVGYPMDLQREVVNEPGL